DPEASRRGGRERPPRSDREECERCGRPMATGERSRDVERDQLPNAQNRNGSASDPAEATHRQDHDPSPTTYGLHPLRLPEMVETTRLPEPGREHDENP